MDTDRYQNPPGDNWNKSLDRAMKNLPERPAPAGLISQVMSRVKPNAAEKWYQRLWWRWPLWLRIASCTSILAMIAWLSSIGNRFYETRIGPAFDLGAHVFQTVVGSFASVMGGIQINFDGDTCRFILLAISFLIMGMYLTCIGVGTFIYRTARR